MNFEELTELRWKTRQRDVILTDRDEALLSEALRAEFPAVVFYETAAGDPPSVRTLHAIPESTGVVHACVPSNADEVPHFLPDATALGGYILRGSPRAISMVRCDWLWSFGYSPEDTARFAFDPPTRTVGWITASWAPAHPSFAEVPAFVRRVWRVLARLTTNKLKSGTPQMNILERGSDRLLVAEAGGVSVWAGHHALEWCAAGGVRRMLDGKWRPCDDWAPPDDAWYQNLRRRVEQRYGPGFGLPPAEPPEGKASSL